MQGMAYHMREGLPALQVSMLCVSFAILPSGKPDAEEYHDD
jgi:hypothetical protein